MDDDGRGGLWSSSAKIFTHIRSKINRILRIRMAETEQELVTSDELYEFFDYARSGGFSGEDLVDALVHEVVIYEDRLVVITLIKGVDTELMEIVKA